ncbi:hypothetical protein [Arthrobacter sp. SAFR-014]|uniref:hypothetical protein n=1 Tax=unclassified Arthrobacter TaxID=235627 RepID=UPI003F7B7ACA
MFLLSERHKVETRPGPSAPILPRSPERYRGNSGDAPVNWQGESIRVNVAIASAGSSSSSSTQSGNIGVGFSILMEQTKRVGEEISSMDKASHGPLGLSSGQNVRVVVGLHGRRRGGLGDLRLCR